MSLFLSEEAEAALEVQIACKDGVPVALENCWVGSAHLDSMAAKQNLTAKQRNEEVQKNRQKAKKAMKALKARQSKQTKITKFISVPKKPIQKNFQGFSMKRCCYEEDINDFVMIPNNYGTLYKNRMGRQAHFCSTCYLRPCISKEFQQQLFSPAYTISDNGASINEIEDMIMCKAEELMKSVFGPRYTKQNGIPHCVRWEMSDRFPGCSEDSDGGGSGSDSDSEQEME